MITSYSDILYSIKKCEGGIINIIKDFNHNNRDFLFVLKTDLRKECNIVDDVSYDNLDSYIKNINEKTIFFIDFTDTPINILNLKNVNYENNVTIIFITRHYENISNSYIPINNMRLLYVSNLCLVLSNSKIKIIKDRYSNNKNKEAMDINNFISRIRKFKLLKISENSN